MPQPNFVPLRSSTSRNTQRRGMSAGTSTVVGVPLTLKEIAMSSILSVGRVLQQRKLNFLHRIRRSNRRNTERFAGDHIDRGGGGSLVELAFPSRHDDCRQAITHDIERRSR